MPGAYCERGESLSIECRSSCKRRSGNADVVGLQDSAHGAIKFDHKGKQATVRGFSRSTKNFPYSGMEKPRYRMEFDP